MSDAHKSPRIPPLQPPFSPELAERLRRWMPPGQDVPPLALFRTLAVHASLSDRMLPLAAGLLGHGLLAARDREIVIDRTCARCGAEYEWGVHVRAFGAAVGLTAAQLDATATAGADAPCWSDADRLLIRLADELHDTATLSDALWSELAAHWSAPQLLELIILAGWYRLLSGVINAAAIPLEPWGARFPAR